MRLRSTVSSRFLCVCETGGFIDRIAYAEMDYDYMEDDYMMADVPSDGPFALRFKAPAPSTISDISTASSVSIKETKPLRSYFPETWLWSLQRLKLVNFILS